MKNLHKILFLSFIIFLFQGNIYSQVFEGTYTIGTGQDYNNFSDAINDIATTTTDELIFEVMPGTYNEQIILPEVLGGFFITFKKKGGETGEVLLDYDPETDFNYIIQIEGSHYIIQDINFKNSSTMSYVGHIINFNNISGNIDDNIFENCKFTGRTDISSDYTNPGYSVITKEGDGISNIKFINDTIIGGSFSFYFDNPTSPSFDIFVSGCEIKNFYTTGIFFSNTNEFTIEKNTIEDILGINNETSGISITNSENFFNISANKINLKAENNKTCINLSNVFSGGKSPFSLTNNMLMTSSSSNSFFSKGINLSNCFDIDFFYNSIHIQDGNNTSSAIDISDQSNSQFTVLNNLLINTSSGYAMITDNVEQYINSNYNIYYTLSESIIKDNALEYNLVAWQKNRSEDYQSISAMPHFISETDLHISEGLAYVEGKAIPVSETLDFDGDTRDATTPDIGADEGIFTPLWAGNIFDEVEWQDLIYVGANIFIDDIGTLTIFPGTKVIFTDHYYIESYGILNAVGEKDNEIIFTAQNTDIGWGGIVHPYMYIPNKGTVNYEYCKFEYAKNETQFGGALKLLINNISVKNSIFINNSAMNGGAIYTSDCVPTIDANLFINNNAINEGGAIYSEMQEALLINNIFAENNSNGNGGAVSINNTSVGPINFANNTFYNNSASVLGKDLYLNSTSVNIYNSIFWNTVSSTEIIYEISGQGNTIQYCIIKGDAGGTNIPEPNFIPCDNPYFTNPQILNFTVQANSDAVDAGNNLPSILLDFAGNNRHFNTIDIGAFELQAPKLIADAGSDDYICGKTYTTNALNPSPYSGTWTTLDNPVNITNIHSSSTFVSNIPKGLIKLQWTVTNGIVSEFDILEITNNMPYANAGEDIYLIEEDININTFQDTLFNANAPSIGEWGLWTQISGPLVTIADDALYNSDVQDITYGQHLFRWTVEDEGCSNSDEVFIIAGHSFVSAPDDGTLDWDNPDDWDVNGVPGSADSVTIYDCNAKINIPDANCDKLIIGNGGNVTIEGTAKAPTGFTCRTIFIEQNAEKFKNVKGDVNLHINNDATINVGAGYISKYLSTENSGLFIGSGGTVFIEQNAEKNSKGVANMNIGSGGVIFLEQNAEKNSKGAAEMRIGTGGFVFIEQNAEKDKKHLKEVSEGDLTIGSGGFVFIEQNAEKAEGGYLHLAEGRTIFIEQNAEKDASGGHLGIYGGTVFIEQNAEKNDKEGNISSIYCGAGGTIFIEQNAEKELSTANLIIPDLKINGGKVKIGNAVKSKSSTGNLQFRQIFIEQNAEKGFANDTSLIIYPSGGLFLSDSTYYGNAEIVINKNEAVTFYEGSTIDLTNSEGKTTNIILKDGSSFIDMNSTSQVQGTSEHIFSGGKNITFSPSIKDITVNDFGNEMMISNWSEQNVGLEPMLTTDILNSGIGYSVYSIWNDSYKKFSGFINTGTYNIPVSSENTDAFEYQGWNLIGNPYPSSIDFESITISPDINYNFYIYNSDNKNFEIYQQGGVSLNGADQYILPNQAFFIKTDANTTFDIDNTSRIHYFENAKNSNIISNVLKLQVTGNSLSDETAVLFNNEATNLFDYQFDAVKFINPNSESPNLYTIISEDNTPLAINTLKHETSNPVIPLYFESGSSGDYIINVSEFLFDEGISVSLKDMLDNNTYDLETHPSYNFTYQEGDDPYRFQLIFNGIINIDDLDIENDINIFSYDNNIFINSEYENANVKIYNLKGQLLLEKQLSNIGLNTINVNFPQSVYLVKVITKDKTLCKKIVLSK